MIFKHSGDLEEVIQKYNHLFYDAEDDDLIYIWLLVLFICMRCIQKRRQEVKCILNHHPFPDELQLTK